MADIKTSTPHGNPSTPRDQGEDSKPLTGGKLLSLSEAEAVRRVGKLWSSQDEAMQERFARWRVNWLRHEGIPGVGLIRSSTGVAAYIPHGVTRDHVPAVNKASELMRKLTNIVFADPPAPDPQPFSASDEDVYAAQIARKILEDVDSESGVDEVTRARRAFRKANIFDSGFVHYYVDAQGGGKTPITIEAHPLAENVFDALIDPETGLEAEEGFVERYVTEEGTLTDSRMEAAMRDLPSLEAEVLTGRNVRMYPHTAEDLWDADMVMIGRFVPLGKLRDLFPEKFENLSEEKLEKLKDFRPAHSKDIAGKQVKLDAVAENEDETPIWTVVVYHRRRPEYPYGAIVFTAGNELMLQRDEWCIEKDDGTKEAMDIPVTQYMQWDEAREDPYGTGSMDLVGRGNEMRNAQLSAFIDHLDRLNNQKIFLPMGSTMSAEDATSRKKRVFNIQQGAEPRYEQIPQYPQEGHQFYNDTTVEMESAMGMGDTVQGLESSRVKSGRHALAVVQQAHAALSEIKQNTERAFIRGSRVKLQLIAAFFDVPREAGWTTEDDEYKLDYWSGADLGSTRDVNLQAGTLTMLTPAAKAQLAEHYYQLQILPPDEMKRIFQRNIGGLLALEEDPYLMRVKRQISEWRKGPPEGWEPPEPVMQPDPEAMDPETGEVFPDMAMDPVDPNAGMVPVMDDGGQPVYETDPELLAIFEPVPSDMLPPVAQLRLDELSRLMASETYLKKPPEWRRGVEEEWERMMEVLNPTPQPGEEPGPDAEVQNMGGSPGDQVQAMDQTGQHDLAQMGALGAEAGILGGPPEF